MPSVEILHPRLHGGRFEDGGIPLEFLGDLAPFRELVLEVAKWRFKEDIGMRRVPNGFTKSLIVKFTGLETGSSAPVISVSAVQTAMRGISQYEQYAERYAVKAGESIVETIAAAEHGFSPHNNGYLRSSHLSFFDRIGRNLRSDEFIRFSTPSGGEAAYFDQEIRRTLLNIAHEGRPLAQTDIRNSAIRGVVCELDQDNMTFELQPIFGRKVSGPVSERHYQILLDAFNRYQDGVRVLVEGRGKYNRQNRLTELESVEHIHILHSLDVPARLDEFRDMQYGWLDGEGIAPTKSGIDWLTDAFARNYRKDAPLPFTYAMPSGGVQFEWSLGNLDVSLEVDLSTRRAVWHWLDVDTARDYERELDLVVAANWEWLGAELTRLAERAG